MQLIINIFLLLLGLIFSIFFSGTETGLYSISQVKLKLRLNKPQKKYKILRDLLRDRQGMVFSALVGNNISNFLTTSVVTGLFITYFNTNGNPELYTTAILTPVMFIFAEVLPKNIFYTNADVLMPACSRLLWFFNKTFTYSGIVGALKIFSKFAEKMTGLSTTTESLISTSQRHQVMELIEQTHEEGLLDTVQRSIIERFTSICHQRCDFISNPASSYTLVNVKSTKNDIIDKITNISQKYWLVYSGSRGDIIGYIDIIKILKIENDFCDLNDVMQEIRSISADEKLINAIAAINENKIVLLTQNKKTVGVVTREDILEEITIGLK